MEKLGSLKSFSKIATVRSQTWRGHEEALARACHTASLPGHPDSTQGPLMPNRKHVTWGGQELNGKVGQENKISKHRPLVP